MFEKFFYLTINSIILFLIGFSSLFAEEMHLSYTISPLIKKDDVQLEIRLKFQTSEQELTEILLPSFWAGQNELYHAITELECLNSLAHVEDTDQPEVKRIHHAPNETIEMRYCIKPQQNREPEWYYRPLVEKTYFFCFGHCLFITPKMDNRQPVHLTLHWNDFPKEWNLANSFGVQEALQELFLPLSTFQDAVYTGGDFTILQCGTVETPIFIAMRGNWSFSTDHLMHLVETIIEAQRSFWNDFNFPYYLITVISTDDHPNMGGTGLTNTFSIFIGDFPEENEEDWKWLAWLLSHEHFHTWNGTKMMSAPPEGAMYWFTEGFTEYYAVTLNLRTKLIEFEDYISHINSIIYDYYSSPVRQAENERIQQDFWNDWHVQRLPYVRGFLIALNWDKKIRSLTNNEYSLDDVMLALLKKVQEKGNPFDMKDIQEVIGIFMGEDSLFDIENYIIKGEIIPLNEDHFDDFYSLEWIEDIGFNLMNSILKNQIEGVKNESKAYQAGLRNGQKFLNYSCINRVITVFISENHEEVKEIQYLKEEKDVLIPQFVLKK